MLQKVGKKSLVENETPEYEPKLLDEDKCLLDEDEEIFDTDEEELY